MRHWRITSAAGVDLGVYEGDTERDALDALARAAGYASAEAALECGISPFRGVVEEVADAQELRRYQS